MKRIIEMVKIADTHAMRIQQSLKNVCHLFPLDSETVKNMAEKDFVWFEVLVNRFGKLQDFVGTKLSDIYLDAVGESSQTLTMNDKLNKLEKFNIIESADLWKKMRTIRNHIAHEYPEHPELTAQYLNELYELTPVLLEVFSNLKNNLHDLS